MAPSRRRPAQPIAAPTSRPEAIARELRTDILTGRYRPGERLPSERELAARTGANRRSAREALKILEHQRLVEIRPGGARVIPLEQASLDVLAHMLEVEGAPDVGLVAQALDVEELLLNGAVRLAVERASDEELERAREMIEASATARLSNAELLRRVNEIEELIATASRNLVLCMVRNGLEAIFRNLLPSRGGPRLPPTVVTPIARSVVKALARRDAAAAEEGMRSLQRARRKYLLALLESAPATRERGDSTSQPTWMPRETPAGAKRQARRKG